MGKNDSTHPSLRFILLWPLAIVVMQAGSLVKLSVARTLIAVRLRKKNSASNIVCSCTTRIGSVWMPNFYLQTLNPSGIFRTNA